MTLLGPLIGVLAVILSQGMRLLDPEDNASILDAGAALGWLSLLPPGALARAMSDFNEGVTGPALARLVYGVGATVFLGWLWSRSLRRLATRTPRTGTSRMLRRSSLRPGFLRAADERDILGRPTAAVAAKELHGLRRDPRLRSQLIGLPITLLVLLAGGGRALIGTEYAPLVAAVGAFIGVSVIGYNLLGVDDRSFWGYVVSGVEARNILEGKNVAIAVVAIPLALGLGIAGLFAGGSLVTFLVSLLAAVAIGCVWLAVGNVVSVLGAFPMPEGNVFSSRNTPGSAFLTTMLGLATAGGLTLPASLVIAVPWLLAGPGAALIGATLAAFYGVVIYRVGMTMAAEVMERRYPRLLEALDGR